MQGHDFLRFGHVVHTQDVRPRSNAQACKAVVPFSACWLSVPSTFWIIDFRLTPGEHGALQFLELVEGVEQRVVVRHRFPKPKAHVGNDVGQARLVGAVELRRCKWVTTSCTTSS